jgi:hypothetical protein
MNKVKKIQPSGMLAIRYCVRDSEGAETTPSFGHPSNVRRGKGGSARDTPFKKISK